MADACDASVLPPATAVAADAHERQRRGNLQLLFARFSFFACAYAGAAILARKLGAADYGIYGVVISQLLWLEMFTNAGVPAATSTLIASGRHPPGEVERSAQALLLGLSFVLFFTCWMLAPSVARLMRIPNGAVLFRIAIFDLPFAAIYASYDGILHARRQFGTVAAAIMIFGLSKLAGIVALLALGLSLQRVLMATVMSTGIVCALLAFQYAPRPAGLKATMMREIARRAAPMAVYLVLGQVLVNLDLWSLKSLWTGSGAVVGEYVAAVNLARVLMIVPAVQAGVLFASVAWAVASKDATGVERHVQEATRFALIISVAVCILIGIDARELLAILFSRAYADGAVFLWLLLAGFSLFALVDAFSHTLIAAGGQWRVACTLAGMAPIAWFSNYALVPRFGPVGAAVSMMLAMAVTATVTGAMVYRQFGSPIRAATLRRVLTAAAIVAVVSVLLPVRGPLVIAKVAALGVVYLMALHWLGEITASDLGLALWPVKHS